MPSCGPTCRSEREPFDAVSPPRAHAKKKGFFFFPSEAAPLVFALQGEKKRGGSFFPLLSGERRTTVMLWKKEDGVSLPNWNQIYKTGSSLGGLFSDLGRNIGNA